MTEPAAFTLRFRDPATHRLLRDVARVKGVSMSELAERLVAQGLRSEATQLERTLESVLTHLRSYRPELDVVDESSPPATLTQVEHPEPLPRRRAAHTEPAKTAGGAGRAARGGRAGSTKAAGGKAAIKPAGGKPAGGKPAGGKAPGGPGIADMGEVGASEPVELGNLADLTRRLTAAPSAADLPRRRPKTDPGSGS